MAVSRLHDLEDSQMETTLLRSCLSLPKFNFALRTCPPSAIQVSTAAFDNLMRDSLSDLAGELLVKRKRACCGNEEF